MSKKLTRLLTKLLEDDEDDVAPDPLVPSLNYLKENVSVGAAMTRDIPIYEDEYLKLEITAKITRKK